MTTNATITENGNGFPNIGGLCYDSSTDTIYTVVAWDINGGVRTNGPGCGNSVTGLLEYWGSASDASDEVWEYIQSKNYGVEVE